MPDAPDPPYAFADLRAIATDLAVAVMSLAEALEAARAAGVELTMDGDALLLEASSRPPAAVLDALSRYKTEIVASLRPRTAAWSAEDWYAFFQERAGVAEFD